MKSACLVVLMMLSGFGFKPVDPGDTSFVGQALAQTAADSKQHVGISLQFTQMLAGTTTVSPASASKVLPAKAKNKSGASPCSKQPAVNHDAHVIPARNRTRWPQSRFPAEQQQMQCQAQKQLHKPPPN